MINESKLSDIAIDVGEHLGLYDKENQTFTKKELYKHLKSQHKIQDKPSADFIIDTIETSFPKMTIKEAANTINLSTLIAELKDVLKKGTATNPKKVKDLLKNLERFLKEKGDKEIPSKEFMQILKMTEGQTLDGGEGDHISPKDVDKNELAVGIEVEYEHAKGDRIAAIDIALDHLKENPKYYTKLVKSGIVDEPKAIKLAKKLLNVELGERYYQGKITRTKNNVSAEVISETQIRNVIREELKGLLKEDPNLWEYIYNFGNTYIPKKQGR